MGEVVEGCESRNVRQPRPSKNAIPHPSAWSAVLPPRAQNPSKEKQMSVGTLQFIPSSWHMDIRMLASRGPSEHPVPTTNRFSGVRAGSRGLGLHDHLHFDVDVDL